MPWLIAAALLVNGVAWWWFAQQRALRLTVALPTAKPEPPVPTLTLLSERQPSIAPPEPAPERPESADAASDRPEPSEAAVVNPQAPPGAQSDAITEASAAPNEPVEPSATSAAANTAPEEPPPPRAPEPARKSEPRRSRCVLIGPAIGAAEISRWRGAIAGPEVISASTVTLDEPFVTGYRVIVSAPSPEVALARLAADGFDGFVIDRDGRGVRLSLGVFEVRANAERQLAQLRKQGYAAEIQPQQETHKTFWLRAQVLVDGQPRVRTALKTRFPDVSPVWRDCPAGG